MTEPPGTEWVLAPGACHPWVLDPGGAERGVPRAPAVALCGCPGCHCSSLTPLWSGSGVPRVDLGELHPPRVLTAPSPAQLLSYRNLNDDTIPQVGALQVTANIVFGYATWVPFPPPWCCPRLPRSRASGTHPAWAWSGAGAQPRLYHILFWAAGSPWSMLEVLGVAAPSPLRGWGMLAALLSSGQCPRGSKHRGSSAAQGFGLRML